MNETDQPRDVSRNQFSFTGQHNTKYPCKHCNLSYDTYESLFEHVSSQHPLNQATNQSGGQGAQIPDDVMALNATTETTSEKRSKHQRKQIRKSALNDTVSQIEIHPKGDEKYDLLQFFSNVKGDVQEIVELRKKK